MKKLVSCSKEIHLPLARSISNERLLLDTNIPSEIMRRMPDAKVSAWLKMQLKQSQFLSVVTIGEIRKGAVILPPSPKRTQIEQSLEVLILNSEVSGIDLRPVLSNI